MDLPVNNLAREYKKLDVQTSVANANPHELIDMLLTGAKDRLRQAQGAIQRGDHAAKSNALNACVDIIGALQASLDHDEGGEIAANLDSLYEYMQRRLYRTNTDNDLAGVVEVTDLIDTLHEAWAAIGDDR